MIKGNKIAYFALIPLEFSFRFLSRVCLLPQHNRTKTGSHSQHNSHNPACHQRNAPKSGARITKPSSAASSNKERSTPPELTPSTSTASDNSTGQIALKPPSETTTKHLYESTKLDWHSTKPTKRGKPELLPETVSSSWVDCCLFLS